MSIGEKSEQNAVPVVGGDDVDKDGDAFVLAVKGDVSDVRRVQLTQALFATRLFDAAGRRSG